MTSMEIFASRIKFLRNLWELSLDDLAYILDLKNRSNVANWEKPLSYPKITSLINLSNFFCIPIEWLLGQTNIPYSHDFLLNMEHKALANYDSISYKYMSSDEDYIIKNGYGVLPYQYTDDDTRSRVFSLEMRTNIIVWFNLCKVQDKYRSTILDPKKRMEVFFDTYVTHYSLRHLYRELDIALSAPKNGERYTNYNSYDYSVEEYYR